MTARQASARARRLRFREAGLCKSCRQPSPGGYAVCEACNGKPHRWPVKGGPWATVDWSLSNGQIARQLGLTPQCVLRARRRRGIPPSPTAKPGRPRKIRENNFPVDGSCSSA